MRVTQLRVYPVKSLGGQAVTDAQVEPWGLAGDRRWGIVDEAGKKVTARELRALLGLRAEVIGADAIRIHADSGSIVVPTPRGFAPVPVSHARQGLAVPARDCASDWVSARVGRPVRLVWQEDPTVRSIDEEHGGHPGDSLTLADAGPLLLTSEASLAQLQDWIDAEVGDPDPAGLDPNDLSGPGVGGPARVGAPLSMIRFRPNLVIDGEAPFAEDDWPTVRIGDLEFRTSEICDRCVMTTIDPVTLAGGKEPIRTLARHRRWDRKTWFGTRLVPLGVGELRVGDAVLPGRRA
ncbi:MOSC domain-containing protein [Occultella glacieicola]|uniref:MOSC domain-containing protein n=1 Tax=Occultella glacieicola TaxID=2518684 RepID=A0ABY2DZB4_9MICO|nr:MOSC N-terminal beta barrel domain-containing protein [Occultella glacieicola]TDE90034.1 MOSC domain-containing protein [Occultella glacieicola]